LLYVSVKMENPILAHAGNLFPHVFFSSSALLGDSCDCSKAVILIHTQFFILFVFFWVGIVSYCYCCCCFWFSFRWNGNRRQCGSWALLFLKIMVMLSYCFVSFDFEVINTCSCWTAFVWINNLIKCLSYKCLCISYFYNKI
jgi:hypothetical protein